ncbi:MAG TPA: SIR2 family protein [Azospirillum sp.]
MTTTPPPASSLDDILAIRGNRAAFDALVGTMAEGKAVAFVGAGASAGLYPLWDAFIDQLADHAVTVGKAESKDAARWKADRTSTPQQRVNTILRKLGEPAYRNFLRETFRDKPGADGKRYTPVHAALLRLSVRGYVTTNYDPALDFARRDLRPDVFTTGTPTWQDDDEVHRWHTGDVFEDECPMLWLHGYWQRPQGIVLNAGEYADAYKPGLYRRLFERLWAQDRLVFVGFGFNDPQFTFMVGEYLREIRDANALPRHVAILGLPVNDDGTEPDPDAIDERRATLEEDYHVRPLFYPVRDGGRDHSALHVLLDALAIRCGGAPQAAARTLPPPPAFPSKWVHEASDDERFVGREEPIADLDRWVRDDKVRAVAVCAVGGTGKTALIGHWLKRTDGWRTRPFAGLFAWSFYQDRDAGNFLRAFLDWAHETLGMAERDGGTDLPKVACGVLAAHPLVLVLDGLEVVQEAGQEENDRYGSFLDGDLREFLRRFCRGDHRSLAVLTSRFAFADLTSVAGTAFHQLDLPGLPAAEGAALLSRMGSDGDAAEHEEICRRLEGHPLGLRVFADALPREHRDQPLRFLDDAFRVDALSADAPLYDKLRRLLTFYERALSVTQVRLLAMVALFRSPVAEATVLRLIRGVFEEESAEALPSDDVLAAELRALHARSILSREPMAGGWGYASHPILRDHFRAVLLEAGTAIACRAADLLSGAPSGETPRTVEEIEPVLLAIDLLLDADEFEAADSLYRERLENDLVFLNIPAPRKGMAAALSFVRDEARRQRCVVALSQRRLAYYLNSVGLYASISGDNERALVFFGDAAAIHREWKNVPDQCVGLQNESDSLAFFGRLEAAQQAAGGALRFALQERDDVEVKDSFSRHGWASGLAGASGYLRVAVADFARANELEKATADEGDELYSNRGVQWADVLMRGGDARVLALTRRRVDANLSRCRLNHWNEDIACCHWMHAEIALAEGRLDDVAEAVAEAKRIFLRGSMLFELAGVHVTAGRLALARRQAAEARAGAADALDLAAPRGMRLVQADALVLRGRAWLLDGDPRARDDGEEALRLARACGYGWGERDSLALLAEALAAQGHPDKARRAREEADALSAQLRITMADLDAAEAEAKVWLTEWQASKPKK